MSHKTENPTILFEDQSQKYENSIKSVQDLKADPKFKNIMLKSIIADLQSNIVLLKSKSRLTTGSEVSKKLEKDLHNFIHFKNYLLLKRESLSERYIEQKVAEKLRSDTVIIYKHEIERLNSKINEKKLSQKKHDGGLIGWFGMNNKPVNREPLKQIRYENQENKSGKQNTPFWYEF